MQAEGKGELHVVGERRRYEMGLAGEGRGAQIARPGAARLGGIDGDERAISNAQADLAVLDPVRRERRPVEVRRLPLEENQPRAAAVRRLVDQTEPGAHKIMA